MPQLLSRTLALLLLPCLIADPSLAVVLNTSKIVSVAPSFLDQALAIPEKFIQSALSIFGEPDASRSTIFQQIANQKMGAAASIHIPNSMALLGRGRGPLGMTPDDEGAIQPGTHKTQNEIVELCIKIEANVRYQEDPILLSTIQALHEKALALNPAEAAFVAHRGPVSAGQFERSYKLLTHNALAVILLMQIKGLLSSIDGTLLIFRETPIVPGTNVLVIGIDAKRAPDKALRAIENAFADIRAASPSIYELIINQITTIQLAKLDRDTMASHNTAWPGVLKVHWPMRGSVGIELPLAIIEEAAHDRFDQRYREENLISEDFIAWEFPQKHDLYDGGPPTPFAYLGEVDASIKVLQYLEGTEKLKGKEAVQELISDEILTLREKFHPLLQFRQKGILTPEEGAKEARSISLTADPAVTAYDQLRVSQAPLADVIDGVVKQFQSQLHAGGIARLREGLARVVLYGIEGQRSPGELMRDLAQAFILFETDPAGAQRLAEDCVLTLKPYLGTAATEPGPIAWWPLAQRLLAMYLEAFPTRGSQAHQSEIATWFRNQLLHAFEQAVESGNVKLESIGDRGSLKRGQMFYLKTGSNRVQAATFLEKYGTDTGGGSDMYSFRTITAQGLGEINSDDGEYSPRLEDEIGFRIAPVESSGEPSQASPMLPPLLPSGASHEPNRTTLRAA